MFEHTISAHYQLTMLNANNIAPIRQCQSEYADSRTLFSCAHFTNAKCSTEQLNRLN